MAAPATPENFNVQTGQGSNFLSWDITSLSTTYLVQRSLDGVSFSTVSTITGSPLKNFYTDAAYNADTNPSGVQPGTKYYYKIAASNTDGASAYTASQNIVPAPVGQSSLLWLRLMSQLRADMFNSQFVSLPEWNSYISNSWKELYDILIQKFGDDYFCSSTYTWTTDGNSQLYPLPDDFYKSSLVEVALNPSDPNSWVTLRKYNRIQQNLWNYPNVYTFYGITNIRYRFTGNFLQLVPIASGGQTVRMWYSKRPYILMADTDIIDGVSGWEDYVILTAARKALVKQEQDVSEIDKEILYLKQRIEEAAENRDIGEPETVSDSRVRNLSWSDDGSYGGGNGW